MGVRERHHSAPPPPARYAARAGGIPGSAIDRSISLLQAQTHSVISFAMGSPAPQAMPLGEIGRITTEIASRHAAQALSYGPTEGERSLRAELLRFLREHDEDVVPEELLVTAGG